MVRIRRMKKLIIMLKHQDDGQIHSGNKLTKTRFQIWHLVLVTWKDNFIMQSGT